MFEKYYWVLGVSPESGKKALIGPYATEGQAQEAADDLDDTQIYALGTKNQQKAAREIKAKILRRERDLDTALEPQLHERGLQQEGVETKPASFGLFQGNPIHRE